MMVLLRAIYMKYICGIVQDYGISSDNAQDASCTESSEYTVKPLI